MAAIATDEKISLGFLKSPEGIIGEAGFVCENIGEKNWEESRLIHKKVGVVAI